MGNLFAALPQAAVKYSYMHSDTDAFRRLYEKVYGLAEGAMDSVDLSQFGVTDPQYALGPEALAIPSGVVMWDVLTIISGLFWTLVYIILIYKGFKDKTCGMPLFVLGLNWAWEFQMGFLGEPFMSTDGTLFGISAAHGTWQRVWDCIWFIFDCVLIYLKIKYGKKEFKATMPHAPSSSPSGRSSSPSMNGMIRTNSMPLTCRTSSSRCSSSRSCSAMEEREDRVSTSGWPSSSSSEHWHRPALAL